VSNIFDNTCGFADFLRGCCALLKFCKAYNYKLLVNYKSHIVFKFFEYNPHLMGETAMPLLEVRAPKPYEVIDAKLDELFRFKRSFNVFTNALYRNNINIESIDFDIKMYVRSLLTPNHILEKYFNDAINKIGLNIDEPYIAIHFRVSDGIMHTTVNNSYIINLVVVNTRKIMELNRGKQILFISNSKPTRDYIKTIIPEILYSVSDPIHLGVYETDEKKIAETLVDLLLFARCIMIYSLGYSGFSYLMSKIYDINYKIIRLITNYDFEYSHGENERTFQVSDNFKYNTFTNKPLVGLLRKRMR